MGKIKYLNKNSNLSEMDVSEESTWIASSRKRWDDFAFDFTKRWSYICLTLIIIYCFGFIKIPIIYFISLVSSPFIPIAILRFVILKFIFSKFPP
jgi:hypothetical protein